MNSPDPPADTHDSPTREPRLPPNQIETDKWPVLQYGTVPHVTLDHWDFQVVGKVDRPLRFTWEEFQALPRVRVRSDIHCVTRWSRFDNLWEGVAVTEVLRRAGVRPEAHFVVARAEQGFTTNLPLTELENDDVLLADKHDGVPLTPEHGWPLRLVVPRRYFWKSAKWIRALEVVERDQPGFWEQNGYHNDADPWNEERFSPW
jgi:DMSO/TMAO reductase YedYZ molybdopterin-dependent catalytic subunit